jgi:EamA-like transporter family
VYASDSERGHLAALAAVIIWALVPVGTRFFVLRVDPFVFNIIRYAASGASALPFFLYARPWPGSAMILALAAMGVASSTVGFLLWNYAAALLPAERLGLFLYLIPVVCVAAGAQFLNESLTFPILAGGALTVFGVWIASRTAVPDAPILESTRKMARIPFAANIFRGKAPAPWPPPGGPKSRPKASRQERAAHRSRSIAAHSWNAMRIGL